MEGIAFIIGNGPSRTQVDLEKLVGQAPIYGCNALYRNFNGWDYLVAIDDGMIEELRKVRKDNGILIIPPEEERWESPEYSPNRRRSNAGMNAMLEAIRREAPNGEEVELYCLGFDFILQGDSSVANIYDGTDNYGPETRANKIDNIYRCQYLEWFTNQHPNITFTFMLPRNETFYTFRAIHDNLCGIDVGDFNTRFNSTPHQSQR